MAQSDLSVLMPVEIDDAVLISTTVAENDYSGWISITTYSIGDRVISTTTHRIYESAQNSNLNKDPDDIENRTGSTKWWIDVSATNAWKMFDGESSSPTVVATSMTIVLQTGFINSLAMLGLVGDQLDVIMKDKPGGTIVYSDTIDLENSLPPDWYEYFFSPFQQQPDAIIDDLPPYADCELTVVLSASSGNVQCGMMQVGDLRPLGTLQYGGKAIPKTYSRVTIDDFGNNKITRRKNARDSSVTALLDADYSDTVIDIVTQVQDMPVVWVGSTLDNFAGLRVFGLGKGELSYDGKNHRFLTVRIEGLI